MKSATAMPLSITRNVRDTQQDHARIDDANGQLVATISARIGRHSEAEQFARYVVHSANAYPKLVEALRKTHETLGPIFLRSTLPQGVRADLKATAGQAIALLRELGEAS